METMAEAGGIIPHHHLPIAGSGYFPSKDTSPSSYFFPSNNTGSQSSSVYRGYGGSEPGSEGIMVYGGQVKGHERRGSEERAGGRDGRRSSGGGNVMIPPSSGSGDRYHLPSSHYSMTPPSSSAGGVPTSYHHNPHHRPHHLQQHQLSPHRGMNPFLHQQRSDEDGTTKLSERPQNVFDAGRGGDQSSNFSSPEKRSLGKEGGDYSPKKGMGVNHPYDTNPMKSPLFYNSKVGSDRHQAGYMGEGRHSMPGGGFDPNSYMADVRESVKEVYDSFIQSRGGKDESGSGKIPEAIPVAYDDGELQSEQQNYREKLERSTSQDAATAMAARNLMNNHEFGHQIYEGAGSGVRGGGDQQRPRAITMNSMYSRRDSPSSFQQSSSVYRGAGKNHDLYTKMREHFNRSEAAMKNHYYLPDKEKEIGGGLVPPMSPTSPYLGGGGGGHQRRPSGDTRSTTHAQSRQESSMNRMMMMISPSSSERLHPSEHRQSFPGMYSHHPQQQMQQLHHSQHQQQITHSDPGGQQYNRTSTNLPSSHQLDSQRKSLDSRSEDQSHHHSFTSSKDPPTVSETLPRPRSLSGSSSARKSQMSSPTGDSNSQKQWPSSSSTPANIPSLKSSKLSDKQHTSSEENTSTESTNFQEKDEVDTDLSSPLNTSAQFSKDDMDINNTSHDKSKDYTDCNNSDIGGNRNENETGRDSSNTPPKPDSLSNSISLSPNADDEEDESRMNDSSSRKVSTDSPDDSSLPDAIPRELLPPKKELVSDGEDDSFHNSSGNYPPMTPPSPSHSSSGIPVGYPPSYPQPPLPHHGQQHPQPFFHSPERLAGRMSHPHFGSPRGLAEGPPGMPPNFPFNKDMPSRFPIPGLHRDVPMGPAGSSFMGGPMTSMNMGVDKDVYFCHLCSYSGKSKSDFDNHMGIHFEYNCPHCDYTSRTEGRLKRHIKDFHTDENGRRSMPGRPKVFKCKQCSFSATEKDKFWEHARSHIKEDKLLQCPKCPFVTEYKHHLEYHLRNHFGSKPFKCNKCKYSCVNKSMLNSHMKSHTNVYQYRCSDCTYATKYCHSLKLHLRKYNHKPATVLNQDGSLPQGADADASGLAINTKRGPPRGPRGPRKDKNDPYFNQMFGGMPPMPMGIPPAMNPMLKGMMPFWPVMTPSGIPGHPAMMPGLPNMPPHMAMRGGDRDSLDMRNGGERDRTSDPEMNGMISDESSPTKDEDEVLYLPCRLCDYVAEGTEALCLHLLQVHKDETGEMASMYGINETTLAESLERARKNKMMKAEMRMERRMSEISSESELEVSEFRRRNTIAGLLSRDNPNLGRLNNEKPFWGPGFGQRERASMEDGRIQDLCYVDEGNEEGDNENETSGGMDILQQMTLKFGGGVGVGALHAERSKSLDAEFIRSVEEQERERDHRHDHETSIAKSKEERKAHGHKESPLDLTKPKSLSPSSFSNPSSPRRLDEFNSEDDDMRPTWLENGAGSELDKVTENLVRKRQFSEVAAESMSFSSMPGSSQALPDPATIVPRKRSRKGKAYKLETLCLKLQERQSRSPHDSDDEYEMNDVEQYQASLVNVEDKRDEVSDYGTAKENDDDGRSDENMDVEKNDEIEKGEKCDEIEKGDDGYQVLTIDKLESHSDDIVDKNESADIENVKDEDFDENKKEIQVKDEPVEGNDNEMKEEGVDGNNEKKEGGESIKKETDLDEAENSFEQLQEAIKDLDEGLDEEENKEEPINLTDKGSSSDLAGDEEKMENKKSEDDDEIINTDNEIIHEVDDDDDDAKTEILGDDLSAKDNNLFDLSDKENSNDAFGCFERSSSPNDKTSSDEVQIEDKVDMINTVLENRKKPLPPAVRRGTELAWKLLNDPVNPVTSIPIPVVSPPPPEWKSPTQQHPTSSMTSPIASHNMTSPLASNMTTNNHPTSHVHLGGHNNIMTSPLKNGIRPSHPFNHQGGLPPSPSINLNMKPHLPIPLPPTPMAFIPPTNRMMPEHAMGPRPTPPQIQPPLPMPVNKAQSKDMYECTYCDLSFRDCVMYTVHMGYHSNRNPFKCNSCGVICNDKVEFFLHMARSPHS